MNVEFQRMGGRGRYSFDSRCSLADPVVLLKSPSQPALELNRFRPLVHKLKYWSFALAACTLIACNISADDKDISPPPFTAQMQVRTSEFMPTLAEASTTSEMVVTFSYSNKWWRVDAISANSKTGKRFFESCMTIPDGIRTIMYPPDLLGSQGKKVTPVATACPMSFPAPGRDSLFVPWLTFCPRPKLPVVDATRIYRLISIPECEKSLFNDKQNEGTYSISYKGAANIFLSNLRIRNIGVDVELLLTDKGMEHRFYKLPPPFESGFPEFEFTLLATTNYQGFDFPARAVVKRMYPAFDTKEPSRTFARVVTEVQILSISGIDRSATKDDILPSKLLAVDLRPANLHKGVEVSYLTTDNGWKPTSDPEIKFLAEVQMKRAMERGQSSQAHDITSAKVLFFGVLIIPPIVFMVFAARRIRHKKINPTNERN